MVKRVSGVWLGVLVVKIKKEKKEYRIQNTGGKTERLKKMELIIKKNLCVTLLSL